MDQRTRMIANVQAHAGDVALLTITAPGADVLPWDSSEGPHRTVVPAARYRWNRTAPQRWRRMHQRAAQRVRRNGLPLRLLVRVWEYQKRGVLHLHVVVPYGTAREMAAARAYVDELRRLRVEYGFGFVDRKLEVREAGHAARYLAKYLGKRDALGMLVLSETVNREDVPGLVVHVDRRLTGRTRVTMRTLRLRRAAYVVSRVDGVSLTAALADLLGEAPTLELLVGQGVESLPPPAAAAA
jgi:hypothetical protein